MRLTLRAAMMAAVERPELVASLTLFEPACLSLTADLPATKAHRKRLEPLFAAVSRRSPCAPASVPDAAA